MEAAWQRQCCLPSGCLLDGVVNLSSPDEIVKIICSNENCTSGPYMHKECFERWEDGLLTYLRSHGRARGWSEKQRRQNLWTKKGYDLAFRACSCPCGRGHLRKDVHWEPHDVPVHPESGEVLQADDGTKKKNRKKHKDLPSLGNKYSAISVRSKSKPIPNSNRTRNASGSGNSVPSIDQGYSSASPANTEPNGSSGSFIFSPPYNARSHMFGFGGHNPMRHHPPHGPLFFPHSALQEIPDNDILQDFRTRTTSFSSSPGAAMSPSSQDEADIGRHMSNLHERSNLLRQQSSQDSWNEFLNHDMNSHLPGSHYQDARMREMSKLLETMEISRRVHFPPKFDHGHDMNPLYQPRIRSFSESTVDSVSTNDTSPLIQSIFDFDVHPDMPVEGHAMGLESWSHLRPAENFQQHGHLPSRRQDNSAQSCPPASTFPHEYLNELKKRGTPSYCPASLNQSMPHSLPDADSQISRELENSGQPLIIQPQLLPENHISMLYNNMDPKKPQVIIVPSERSDMTSRRTFTEIRIIPMRTTTFSKRANFSPFQDTLPPSQVNPYHIKMEGEGYGSDDLRNYILSKLSKAQCSEMNCVLCNTDLPIYDHFPLIDGTMFLSPERNVGATKRELKMEIESKCEYLHAICVRCLEGVHNVVCRMCKARWQGLFHQLGCLYMYDIFAANPCCQYRLSCKHCGKMIVDLNVGLKFFSEYSNRITCPSCKSTDHHFVHPASTFQLFGLVY